MGHKIIKIEEFALVRIFTCKDENGEQKLIRVTRNEKCDFAKIEDSLVFMDDDLALYPFGDERMIQANNKFGFQTGLLVGIKFKILDGLDLVMMNDQAVNFDFMKELRAI